MSVKRLVWFGCIVGLMSCAEEVTPDEGLTDGGTYVVYWDSIPTAIPFNEPFSLSAMVHDASDRSFMYTDRELLVDATMPSHDHGMETLPAVTQDESGVYTVDGMLFHMAGEWELAFQVVFEGNIETATFTVDCCEQ